MPFQLAASGLRLCCCIGLSSAQLGFEAGAEVDFAALAAAFGALAVGGGVWAWAKGCNRTSAARKRVARRIAAEGKAGKIQLSSGLRDAVFSGRF